MFFRFGWCSTNFFATWSSDISSRMDFLSQRMDKKLSVFSVIVDRSHVLIPLNIEKDLSDVAEAAPAVKIILMTVTQFPTNTRFSRDNGLTLWLLLPNWWAHIRRLLEVVETLKWVNQHHNHLWNVSTVLSIYLWHLAVCPPLS